ncbi:Uncharacterised protein [Serratia proteamaculans]|nr:Uncharacterised protein [Serratia proteamaculans]
MKKRFSAQQIISILREAEAGVSRTSRNNDFVLISRNRK